MAECRTASGGRCRAALLHDLMGKNKAQFPQPYQGAMAGYKKVSPKGFLYRARNSSSAALAQSAARASAVSPLSPRIRA